jgi:hypothetical protein
VAGTINIRNNGRVEEWNKGKKRQTLLVSALNKKEKIGGSLSPSLDRAVCHSEPCEESLSFPLSIYLLYSIFSSPFFGILDISYPII